jgi:hypothetical protein
MSLITYKRKFILKNGSIINIKLLKSINNFEIIPKLLFDKYNLNNFIIFFQKKKKNNYFKKN